MNKPKIFLSYAREDVNAARRVCRALRVNGAEVWFDEDSLIGGQRWLPTITKQIRQSDFFIALLSRSSVNKQGVVQREMREALKVVETLPEDRIFVVPVRLEECQPTFDWLQEIHWIDLFRDWTEGIGQILRAILPEKSVYAEPPIQTPFEEAVSSVLPVDEFTRPEQIKDCGSTARCPRQF